MRQYALLVATIAAALGATCAVAQPRDADAVFKALDANGDGAITKDEWLASGRHERAFERIDDDHDGKITPEEMKRALIALARSGKQLPPGNRQAPAAPKGPRAPAPQA